MSYSTEYEPEAIGHTENCKQEIKYSPMPVISIFYGIVVLMYYFDNQKHHTPHIHVKYQEDEAVLAIPEGNLLEGKSAVQNSSWFKLGLKFIKTNLWQTGN